jgi:ferritin-like metal-binding protein YciE
MLDNDLGSESEADPSNAAAVEDLRRQTRAQARQIQSMMDLINQMTTQLAAQANAQMAMPTAAPTMAPKMATPEKYEGGRAELPAFLTNMDLYCYKHDVPNDQDKILTANLHMKGKAANWMQPYVEDYLRNVNNIALMRTDTKNLFTSWSNFVDEMKRIFGEVDAENQAEKAITHLKQKKSVSSYTAEFKQLQARIDWDDPALRTVFENGLKDEIKDSMVHHDKPGNLQALIELATRIDNRI